MFSASATPALTLATLIATLSESTRLAIHLETSIAGPIAQHPVYEDISEAKRLYDD